MTLKGLELMERVQQRAMRMMKGQEHLSCEQRLRAGTAQPREEKAQGDFTSIFKKYFFDNEDNLIQASFSHRRLDMMIFGGPFQDFQVPSRVL